MVIIGNGGEEVLTFPGGTQIRNVAIFLERDFPNIPKNDLERHYVSYGMKFPRIFHYNQ